MDNMPTIAFSKNEGSALSKSHRFLADPAHGFKYFMPRNQAELTTLYSLYTSGKINQGFASSPTEALWGEISSNVRQEFYHRCEDGIVEVIDEHLSWFAAFIKITDEFHDQSFLELLHDHGSVFGLYSNLVSFVGELEGNLEKLNLTRESTHLPYTVFKIHEILKSSPYFEETDFAGFYRRHYLTDEFINSPEYNAMYAALFGVFEKGVSLTSLLQKE